MALALACAKCKRSTPKHCDTKGCTWVICPTHGLLALTAEQRRKIAGRDDA